MTTTKRKDKNHTIRFTPCEIEIIDAKAARAGMSRSAYIRKCCLAADVSPRRRSKVLPVKDQTMLSQVLGLLGATRIANNINQIAYAINSRQVVVLSLDTEAVLRECRDYLKAIKEALYQALGIKDSS